MVTIFSIRNIQEILMKVSGGSGENENDMKKMKAWPSQVSVRSRCQLSRFMHFPFCDSPYPLLIIFLRLRKEGLSLLSHFRGNFSQGGSFLLPERANEKQTKTAIQFLFTHRLLHSLILFAQILGHLSLEHQVTSNFETFFMTLE